MQTEDFELDILGQQPRINRLYTQLTFCFNLVDDQRQPIIDSLTAACRTLPTFFPWTSGKVVYRDGIFKIRVSNPLDSIPLTIKLPFDLDYGGGSTTFGFSFDELAAAEFPFRMLDESLIAPCRTVACPDATLAELPVFMVQANFVVGGLLLTFAGQHGAMDVRGLGEVISLFSKACRGETFTEEETENVNVDRGKVLSESNLGDENVVDKDVEEVRADKHENNVKDPPASPQAQSVSSSSTTDLVWAYFSFSKSSLEALKLSAMSSIPQRKEGEGKANFMSTDDVLTAFTWLSITRARVPELGRQNSNKTSMTTLSRQVDMRKYLQLPSAYPGLMVQATTHISQAETLLQQSTGQIALQLRSALDSTSILRQFRAQLSQICNSCRSEKDGQRQNCEAQQHEARHIKHPPELEVRLSSWARESCCEFDFGFGKPVCVRRPAFLDGAREGLVYFLPKSCDGEIVVGLCLEEDNMQRLRDDGDFVRFGRYIG